MYLKRRDNLNKADAALKAAISIIRQDPVTCTGKAAGWIYVNDAKVRQELIRLSCGCRPRRVNALRLRAMESLRTAMAHFLNEDAVDGRPYGFNYAAVKLSSLTVACDENLQLLSTLRPTGDEMAEAASLIRTVDDSREGILLNLRPLHLMARADYKFRSGLNRRAYELALECFKDTKKLNLLDELSYARVRCERYEWDSRGSDTYKCLKTSFGTRKITACESDVTSQKALKQVKDVDKRTTYTHSVICEGSEVDATKFDFVHLIAFLLIFIGLIVLLQFVCNMISLLLIV